MAKSDEPIFYVYLHREADTNRPFYVGKGCGPRAYRPYGRNSHWTRIARKHGFKVDIMADELTEKLAFEFEMLAIASIPGLCNKTEGGEGACGAIVSEETRRKQSAQRRGRRMPQSAKDAISKSNSGKKRSKEHCEHMSKVLKGKKNTPEVAKLIGEKNRGRKNTPETIQKMKLAQKATMKSVRCVSNGMEFVSASEACRWLRANVYPKATAGMLLKKMNAGKEYCGMNWEYVA